MDESFFGNPSDSQEEITHSQKGNDLLLDTGLHVDEPVISRTSGHLTSVGTKRYGVTNFDDVNVEEDLLKEFDPLSSHTNSVRNDIDEELSTNSLKFIQRLHSTENMELHRGSGLILGQMKETSLTNATEIDGDEATSSDDFMGMHCSARIAHENGGTSQSCKDGIDFDGTAEVAEEGEYCHVCLARLPQEYVKPKQFVFNCINNCHGREFLVQARKLIILLRAIIYYFFFHIFRSIFILWNVYCLILTGCSVHVHNKNK